MKRLTILLAILLGFTSILLASDGCCQHLSPDQFKEKQKAFIIEKAELTAGEAEKFFPVYFELQEKKKELTNSSFKLMQQSRDKEMTDAEYEETILKIYDLRIQSDKIEKDYYQKFKEILSPKKIFMVLRADTRFHRELVREVNHHIKKGENRNREMRKKP